MPRPGAGDDTILLVDLGDGPRPALEALVAWCGEWGHHEVDSYARYARRIAWLEANGFTHRRSFFDVRRAINPPPAPAVWPSRVALARAAASTTRYYVSRDAVESGDDVLLVRVHRRAVAGCRRPGQRGRDG